MGYLQRSMDSGASPQAGFKQKVDSPNHCLIAIFEHGIAINLRTAEASLCVTNKLAGNMLACLLRVNLVHSMRQAQALEHEVPSWLQQLSNYAIWLRKVTLQHKHPPPILHACSTDHTYT